MFLPNVERKTDMTARDFSIIENDHLFFMNSATEAQADRKSHLEELSRSFPEPRLLHWLDFGCSQGEFTTSLCSEWNWPSNQLCMSLLEPVAAHREVAIKTLSRFTKEPPREIHDLKGEEDASYDVILANHSCYYVDDAEQTLRELKRLLRPDGLGIVAIAGQNNFLIELWGIGFDSIGQTTPHWVAEDFKSAFHQQKIEFRTKLVPYEIRFADTPENIDRILRFLFGENWPSVDANLLRSQFSEHRLGDDIHIETHCQHFIFS